MQITSYEYSLTKLKLYTAKKTTRATRNKIHDNIKHSHSKYCTKNSDRQIRKYYHILISAMWQRYCIKLLTRNYGTNYIDQCIPK